MDIDNDDGDVDTIVEEDEGDDVAAAVVATTMLQLPAHSTDERRIL